MDRLAKVAHYIPIKTTHTGSELIELYSSRIVCFYGVPIRIVSDRETQFILTFWERLYKTLDSRLSFSSAYHPQTDG
jgi:hypothetical protein